MSMFSAADGADDGGHDHPELKSFGDTTYAASLMPATPPHPRHTPAPPTPLASRNPGIRTETTQQSAAPCRDASF